MTRYLKIKVYEDMVLVGIDNPNRFTTIQKANNYYKFRKDDEFDFHFNAPQKTKPIVYMLLSIGATYWQFYGKFDTIVVLWALNRSSCKAEKLCLWNTDQMVQWKDVIMTPRFKRLKRLNLYLRPSPDEFSLLDQHCPDHFFGLWWPYSNGTTSVELLMKYHPNITFRNWENERPVVKYGMFQGLLANRVGMSFMRTIIEMIG